MSHVQSVQHDFATGPRALASDAAMAVPALRVGTVVWDSARKRLGVVVAIGQCWVDVEAAGGGGRWTAMASDVQDVAPDGGVHA